ncbi:hypothetical protein ACEPAI_8828 [Sanghuangporus weigelae]
MMLSAPRRIDAAFSDTAVRGMLALLKASPFPEKAPIDSSHPWKLGIDYEYLKKLKYIFETEWSWESLQKRILKFDHYLVHCERDGDGFDLHYIHAKSPRSDAIPLILLHGWPGTFFDFHRIIETLTNPEKPDLPAFHVVVPSLPGYFLSTLPRRSNMSIDHIAAILNELMTTVLGYKNYVGQGGDWGSMILRMMGSMFPDQLSLTHYNMFYTGVAPDNDLSRYSESEKKFLKRFSEVKDTEFGYLVIQTTKPFTIGFAIASSPLAILTYIGDKIYGWSDPELLNPLDIIDTTALYYLSGSFATSVMMYYQSAVQLMDLAAPASEGKFLLKNKFGFSAFPYELGRAPRKVLETYGPLVYLKEHSSGGHFPSLDSPKEFMTDLREFFGGHWESAWRCKL